MTEKKPRKRGPVLKSGTALDQDLTVVGHLGGSRKVDLYLCRSKRLEGIVAVKVLRPEFRLHFNSLDAIREEGEVLQLMRHPNVIAGYGMELEDHPRVVMQHLEGETVSQAVLSGNYAAFTVGNLVSIIGQVADALTYVHERGFLHLDVKPSNVMYANGHATLFDFSVAEEFTPGERLKSNAGTRDYMAPEQTDRARLSYATDVFGMGALFYELLTGGTTPFPVVEVPDPDDEGETIRELDYTATPVAPSSINPRVSSAIDAVALKSIAIDPDERYATPADFKRALARAIRT
jgi:eukaryotic-like serine/threonine-protein kinase